MKKNILFIAGFFFSITLFAAVLPESTATSSNTATPSLAVEKTASTAAAPMPAVPTLAPSTTNPIPGTPSLTPRPTLNKPAPALGSNKSAPIIPVPPAIEANGYLLMDAESGYVIAEKNQHTPMAPASLTKLMTMYVASTAIKEGRIHLTDMVPVSETAWRTGGSRMFIKVGSQVPLQDLINGIVIASGNDASVAMSEFIAGSESAFVDLMNKVAAQLGMKDTHYADATGLPDPKNYTTPYDLSILARAIIYHHPEDYKWYSQKWMTYNNIKQPNRNLLLFRDPTVDGLKTGHTDDAGYCLVASAKRNEMRLIAIVMGSANIKQRAIDTQALLNYGFRFFETHRLYAADTALSTQRILFGEEKNTALGLAQNMYVTIPLGQYEKLKASLTVTPKLKAPIKKGEAYGQVQVMLDNKMIATASLIALSDNPLAGFFARMWDYVHMWVS